MTTLAYCRVSTADQSFDGQVAAVKAAGASVIFKEKISGVRADRPQLAKLMKVLSKGDTLIITKIDRLARSTRELLNLIHAIDEKGAALKSLGDPLFNTGSAQGRLLVAVLGAVAEFERELIRERTGEGRKRAMRNGVKFGRPRKLSPYQLAEAVKRKQAGESWGSLAQSYGISLSTVSRL